MTTKKFKNLPQKLKKTKPFDTTHFIDHDHPYKPKKNKFREYKRKH